MMPITGPSGGQISSCAVDFPPPPSPEHAPPIAS
eukprot:CAMPEP_0172916504 /NCGR_PEP_ID=MMETSP1075-20121228/196485_1 /TAXON_ID=2916 /ORGANISM="Ceratium fusus, Strain PA161109" /LENGTH=33 /DNA_ID= /DNA_START= /DNA_END= /DNA_ORIENTATION=